MMSHINSVFIIFVFLLINFVDSDHFNDEEHLRHDLFVKQKVNKQSRPLQYLNDTLTVNFNLMVNHIAELDETTETLTVNCWVGQSWIDFHFKWEPSDYGSLYYLVIPSSLIWVPDIYLINSANAKEIHPIVDLKAIMIYYGRIWWETPATFKSICPLDLRTFPFDEQICRLIFVSWNHWESELIINMMRVNTSLTRFMVNQHNEWEVVSSHGNLTQFFYPDYPQYPFNLTTYYIHLRRRAPYYRLALMIPCLMTMMATLAIFWVPPTVGEKFFIGGMNVLSLVILLIHLYWVVPRTGSNIPAIMLLCGNSLIFGGLSLIISIITTSLCRRNPSLAPPIVIRNLLSNGFVSTMLCLQSGVRKISCSGNAQLLINEEEEEEEADDDPEHSTPNSSQEWFKVAVAVDRFFFLFYCIAFIVILSVAFG